MFRVFLDRASRDAEFVAAVRDAGGTVTDRAEDADVVIDASTPAELSARLAAVLRERPVRNEFAGHARSVVQAGWISGGVHLHLPGPEDPHVADDYRDVLGALDDVRPTARDWLADRVDAFIAGQPKGYFFIEGKTGVGKTTFLALYAAKHNLPRHFVTNTGTRRTASGALRALGNQLITRYELSDDPASTADPVGFQQVLHAAARAAASAPKPHRLVLAIDGLDLAVEHGDLPLALPVRLPDNAYVVATVREGIALYARQPPYGHVRIEPDGEDNESDIRRHVDEALRDDDVLRELVAAKTSPDAFRDELARRCAGVWIYLRHVLADVRAGRVAPDDLQSLPVDLWTYYSRTLTELSGDSDLALPALSALACANEPLTLDTLTALADVGDDPVRVRELRAVVTGRLRAFARVVGPEDDRRFTTLHDSARDYLAGVRPDDPMTGDERQLDLLALTAATTRRRLADRYLTALFGPDGIRSGVLVADPARLGGLDGGYGLRNLAGHLAELDAVDQLHALLTTEVEAPGGDGTPRRATAWFLAHEAHGTFVEYRASLALGRRQAAEATDFDLAEGGSAPSIAAEVRYALMDGSVESVIASTRPGLLRTLVEGRIWAPRVALGRIQAVRDHRARVELVAALAAATRPDGSRCLSPRDARQAWTVVFPPASKRALDVAGAVLPLLPPADREAIVRTLLDAVVSGDQPFRAEVLGMLGAALTAPDLERAVAIALDGGDDTTAAWPGLIPHVAPAALPRVLDVLARRPHHPESRAHRALAVRLAAERLSPDWVTTHLAGQLLTLGTVADTGQAVEHVRALIALVDDAQLARASDLVLDRASESRDEPDFTSIVSLAPFLRGPVVDRALALTRTIGVDRPHWARARTLAALVQAVPSARRPALVAEALRALPDPGSRFDLLRDETLIAVAGHVDGKTVDVVRKAGAELEARRQAHLLAVLATRVPAKQAGGLRREAVRSAASCQGWQRADALRAMAPHLDHETRLLALDLLPGIGYGLGMQRHRADALEALVAGSRDEDEVRHAARVAGVIGDVRPQADVLAALVGRVPWERRAAVRERVERLANGLALVDRADLAVTVAGQVPEAERGEVLRWAATLVPDRRPVGDHRFAERLAAVGEVLTGEAIRRRLADAVDLPDDNDALDVWRALGPWLPEERATDKFWRGLRKKVRTAPVNRFARYLAMAAPHVDADEVDDLRAVAEAVDARFRPLPLAALAARLDGEQRRQVVARVMDDLRRQPPSSVLQVHPVVLLAEAMTDAERDELVDLVVAHVGTAWWYLDLLGRLLPALTEAQRVRACGAGIAALSREAAMPGRDFRPVARHATVPFLRALVDTTRFAAEDNKGLAAAALLASHAGARASWHREVDGLPPVRDLLSGLGRPGVLTVLAEAAPHLASYGGNRVADACVAAVEDVVRWWP